ncbi:DeoR/GlpR family transcriptional regulator [Agarilytica rhodophyticola]|uniref:DeoR/GlpR family transcriptional regulator n=1 Tax=Agarilytica rhodophyticola TaxID=1737490 RepID=UPI000B348C76|nr:DeoR/GlpR family transcriptional regulator [Agarilytica rhodophyticola]
MNQTYRHSQILQLIQERNFVSIDELVEHFKVTPQTIRRDLNTLAKTNAITRHHGGACLGLSTVNTEYSKRKVTNQQAKNNIAKKLVQLIPDNSSLFINIGTTTEAVAQALLHHKNLKVVTNNIHVASILSENESCSIIVAGGEVRNNDGGIIGESTVEFIDQFQMDFGIIGISGIDDNGSLLDYDYREVKVSRSIIRNSRQVLLAADQTKFGRNAMIRLGNINEAHHFFTDFDPSKNIKTLLETNGVQLHKT